MARRYRSSTPNEPSSLGGSHVENALELISKTCLASAAVQTHYTEGRDRTIAMLFPPEVIDKANAARDIIDPASNVISYEVEEDVQLTINYKEARTPAIQESAMRLQPTATKLLDHIKAVKAIYDRFEEVKAVLEWLNRNATPGAIRYYFPTAMLLCPKSPALLELQHVPSRFSQPLGVTLWIQAMKDASTTWTGSTMLPNDARPQGRDAMWLTFKGRRVLHPETGETFYYTKPMTFNL
jgi:hypothetical protein